MYPVNPERSKPMSEEEGVKKMTQIGALMQEAGMDFGEEDMRLLRDAFMGSSAYEDQMEELIARYSGLMDDEEADEILVEETDDETIDFSELG